jgi:hypothetical protein
MDTLTGDDCDTYFNDDEMELITAWLDGLGVYIPVPCNSNRLIDLR